MGKFVKGGPNPGRKFAKGVSGNPNGRPKAIVEVAAAIRKVIRDLDEKAIKTLESVMDDKKATASARVTAAAFVYEHNHGKAPQVIDLRKQLEMKDLSDDELTLIAGGATAEGAANGGNGVAAPTDNKTKPH